MKFFLILCVFVLLVGCGSDNSIEGEDYGNIAQGELGVIVVQSEHSTGWTETECLGCHPSIDIHVTDHTGTGLNMQAIRDMVDTLGNESCSACHGGNGI